MTPDSGGERLLEVRDLATHFLTRGGIVRAVDGVSFGISPGETLGIVGESGSGKSVLALTLMRLLPPAGRIVSGSVRFEGTDLLALPEKGMQRVRGGKIAIVFQEPMTALNPVFTVGSQIAESVRLHQKSSRTGSRKVSKRDAMREAERLMALVGISDPAERVHEFAHRMSGGMRQRVLLAMALAGRPSLLIADEPTTALDVTTQALVLDLIRKIQREMGLAVILITHDLGVIAGMADRVAVMYCGRIVEESGVRDLYREPRHPYTRGLLESVPRVDGAPAGGNEPLPSIPGSVPRPLDRPEGCAFHPRCAEAHDRCRAEEPHLTGMGSGRSVACFLHEGVRGAPVRKAE